MTRPNTALQQTDARRESLGSALVDLNQARQFIRHCSIVDRTGATVDERARFLRSFGYGYFKAQAIAEISKYVDAFICDGEMFDWRGVK